MSFNRFLLAGFVAVCSSETLIDGQLSTTGSRPPASASAGPLAPSSIQVFDPGLIAVNDTSASIMSAGPVVVFHARESTNGADLNGDGDTLDRVPHVYDGRTKTLTSLGWSIPGFSPLMTFPGEKVCAFIRGGVVHLFMTASRQLIDTGADAIESETIWSSFDRGPHELAFGFKGPPSEVVSCFDTLTGTLFTFPNYGGDFQALGRRFFRTDFPLLVEFDLDTHVETTIGTCHEFLAGPDLTAVWQREWLAGSDQNGDGDTDDVVTWIRDEAAGTFFNTHLAMTDRNRDLPPKEAGITDELLMFGVWELAHGVDLNGDGGFGWDTTLQIYDQGTQTLVNTGCDGGSGNGLHVWNRRVSFVSSNTAVGVWDLDSSTLLPTGFAAISGPTQGNEGTRAFLVEETAATGDLNGDGDVAGDDVLHLFDVDTLGSTNLGIAATSSKMGRHHLAFTASEAQEGSDLNGDGDMVDSVLHVLRLRTGVITNLGSSGSFPFPPPTHFGALPRYGDELSPWFVFETTDHRPLLIRVH